MHPARSTAQMSPEQRQAVVAQLMNFPIYPTQAELQGRDLELVLRERFPLGCPELGMAINFDHKRDSLHHRLFPSFPNIFIGIKYGCCHFFSQKQLDFFKRRLQSAEERGGNLYIYCRDKDYIYALVKLVSIAEDITFRFWYFEKQPRRMNPYPLGIGRTETLAVGKIKLMHYTLPVYDFSIYHDLRDTRGHLLTEIGLADSYERQQRERHVNAIRRNDFNQLDKDLQQLTGNNGRNQEDQDGPGSDSQT